MCGLKGPWLRVDLDADDVVTGNEHAPRGSLIFLTRERLDAGRDHRVRFGRVDAEAVHGAGIAHEHDPAFPRGNRGGVGSFCRSASVEQTCQ